MAAIHYGPMASESNDIGSWANNSLTFMIPILHEELQNEQWVIRDVGVVPAYTYVDSTIAAITHSEVFGIPTTHGQFLSPPSVWMTPDGLPPAPLQPLLSAAVELLPARDEGQRVATRVVTEILQTVSTDRPAQPQDAGREAFCRALSDERTRKYETKSAHSSDMKKARTLALKLLADGSAIKQYTLKQFRDVTQPERACYQSLTCIERTFNEVFLLKEMELPLRVQIHEYPTQPLVKLLGLVYQERRVGDGSMVYTLEPLRPFWIHATMTESLGTRILFRAGDCTWRKFVLEPHPGVADAAPIQECQLPRGAKLQYSKSLDALLNDVPPLRLQSLLLPFRSPAQAADAISTYEGLQAARQIDPQMVIESVLSREWEDRTPQARWLQQQERMARELSEAMKAALPGHRSAVRRRYILKQLKHAQSQPFQPDVHGEVLALLDRVDELAVLTDQIEASCEAYRSLLDSPRAPAARTWKRHDKTMQQHFEALRDDLQRYCDRYLEQTGHRLEYLENFWNAADGRAAATSAAQVERQDTLIRRYHQRELTQQLLGLLLAEHDRVPAATLDKLAKACQKPDVCVRRDIAGADSDRLFPRELSWAEQWYVGWREP